MAATVLRDGRNVEPRKATNTIGPNSLFVVNFQRFSTPYPEVA